MIVFLIGFRGSGKSTVAVRLAARLGCACVDTDQEIELQQGQDIPEIFASSGESGFREIESQVVADLISRLRQTADPPVAVVALGGGAVLDPTTRTLIAQTGRCIWLQADADVLIRRLATDTVQRPALTSETAEEEVRQLLRQRHPVYADCADYTIDVDTLTPDEVADQIAQWLGPVDNQNSPDQENA